MPKISIITTTYKHQDFIAQTIESVLSQTYTDRELLIWDDSPDDLTRNIILWYINKYPDKIKARHHKPNKWIVDNMNFLISHICVQSEYISFLEWDDIYTVDNLQQKIHIFEQYPEVKLVYSGFDVIDQNSNIIKKNPIANYIKNFKRIQKNWKLVFSLEDLLKIWNPIQSFWSVILSREILNTDIFESVLTKFGTSMFWPLDYYVWINILPNCTIYNLDKKIFRYRNHENNFVKNKNIMFSQFEMIYQDIINNNQNNHNIINICNSFISWLRMTSALLDNDIINAKKYRKEWFIYDKTWSLPLRLSIWISLYLPKFVRNFMMNLYAKM